MTFAPGSRVGGYEIVAPLGAGGMGEVFRARDTKLNRDVAIKVLPAAFAEDRERVARFRREAQLIASLNHPNVAAIHGLEESDGVVALALELVDGEDLEARLARGPLPLDEAVAIARQIAQGLEAAHEKGIVHRDLKPANVKLTRDGVVKILDFGLAKAYEGEAARGSEPDLSRSPTMSRHMTEAGMILGTAAYMSPEQARGRDVDKRTDVWAFGVVLWEMLTGKRLFAGETVTDVLAAVLTREVDWSALPRATPAELRRLLRLCLERNPKNRLHDIADARIALAELELGGRGSDAGTPAAPAPVERRGARALRWAGLAVLAVAAGAAASRLFRPAPASLPSYRRLTNDGGLVYTARFAPDGATVVYGEASSGNPVALFSTPADSAAPRRFEMPSADVVGISANGQMAVILDRHYAGSWLRIGTLAQAPVGGGAPRALLEGVYDADISRDGASFAVVRDDGGGQRIELPPGKTLYRATGWISSPRISADGRRIAIADHPLRADDQGFVAIVDTASGKTTRVSPLLNFLHGVAWSPDGREVFASSGDIGSGTALKAYRAGRAPRDVLNSVGLERLQDVSAKGRVLITSDSMQVVGQGRLAGGSTDYLASLFGESFSGISQDGRSFCGSSGSLAGGTEYHSFFRLADGSPPVILSEGEAMGMTPDGRWVFTITTSRDRSTLKAEPTGPGEVRKFDLGKVDVVPSATERITATVDGTRVGFAGVEGSSGARGYVLDLDAKRPPRAVTPPGVRSVQLSPRGDALAAVDASGALQVYPVDGGAPRAVPGSKAGEVPVAWTGTGDAVFVWDRTIPARIQRIDLASGKRELAFEWQPRETATPLYGLLTVTTDARYYLMRYRRAVSSLAVADGVR